MANQPSFIPSAWAANNSTTETIPATTTESGKASWDQGFPVETSLPLSEGGIPPKYGDFNGVLNVLSQFCLFAQAGGQFTWSSTLAYSVGSIVVGSDGSIYRAVQVTTNVNPVGDTSGKWERIVSQSDIAALEADIQTAMTNAANAVANASAAQSAVTTLDANVVKLSGNQSVGGVKKFTSNVTIDGNIVRSANTGEIRLSGGTDANTTASGASLSLYGSERAAAPGMFILAAGTSSIVYSRLIGKPDGTLQWGGKDIITNGGDQIIAGTKTFSAMIAGSINGNAATATKLATARSLKVKLDSDTAVTFDGSAAQDAIPVTGTLPVAHGGTGLTSLDSFVQTSGNQTIGGVKKFTSNVAIDGNIVRSANTSEMRLSGGTNANTTASGASLSLYGSARSSSAGAFIIAAGTSSTVFSRMIGLPDGTLTWRGQPIQTSSDERLKTTLSDVPDAVLDAWGDVGWGQFQYLDAVEKKGVDKARLHLGLIAQRVKAVFEARGLDACKYGILCYEAEDDIWMVRYEEALAMETAYQRRRADRAEARIADLERRLGALEAAIASLISPVGDETYAEPEQEQDAEQEGEE